MNGARLRRKRTAVSLPIACRTYGAICELVKHSLNEKRRTLHLVSAPNVKHCSHNQRTMQVGIPMKKQMRNESMNTPLFRVEPRLASQRGEVHHSPSVLSIPQKHRRVAVVKVHFAYMPDLEREAK